ncbi:2-oxoglutarate-dependent dioxygenase 19-like [Gastrolobium bilobum]|uniref:2-oxoglutarate-dependent dioxygenase 19-like n=1 Tax=Gastrolobium bilobum TaxID=150636 RepID=UPI002AAF3C40|nr:2-oxoglutarate-dependent dioxygenase 19-like [Gastrolobium bilobum]
MASATTVSSSEPPKVHASDISSIKAFAESNGASPIPSTYYSLTEPRDDVADELASSIPVIDFSLLTSHDPQIHSPAVHELAKACAEWGFFMLTNHGIPENLIQEVMRYSKEFHDLPVEAKNEYGDKGTFSPIRHGTSFHPQAEKHHFWRDYLKVITHPEFNFPNKPPGYREVAFEYCQKVRAVVWKLLEGVTESLGLEPNSIIESTGFDSGFQIFAVNLYPPCPQPDLALGMPAHSDHGLITLLTQNGIGGLQVKHDGKWVNVNPIPKCLVVNINDQLEAVSNGRYKSVLHRAILNNKDTRISLVLVNGPALDKEIGPAPELLEKEKPLFKSIKFQDYYNLQQKGRFADKSGLDVIRLNA